MLQIHAVVGPKHENREKRPKPLLENLRQIWFLALKMLFFAFLASFGHFESFWAFFEPWAA